MQQKIFESGASLDDAVAMAEFLAPIPNGDRLAGVLRTREPVSTRAYDDDGWRARFVISDGINVKCFTVTDITIDEAEMIAAQCLDMPVGEDTYQAAKSAQFYVPIEDVRAKVMAEIGQFCDARSMTFVILDSSQTQPPFLPGNYPAVEVHFKCAVHNVEHVR